MKNNKEILTIIAEINALDYLEKASFFISQTKEDSLWWKWVTIALHGALYSFAICACKGTDYYRVTYLTSKEKRKLISFDKVCIH